MCERITYAIEPNTELVWSKVGCEFAIPTLDYDKMMPENDFEADYHLEKVRIPSLSPDTLMLLRWTRKIPIDLKNRHRSFWGFKPLRERIGKVCIW